MLPHAEARGGSWLCVAVPRPRAQEHTVDTGTVKRVQRVCSSLSRDASESRGEPWRVCIPGPLDPIQFVFRSQKTYMYLRVDDFSSRPRFLDPTWTSCTWRCGRAGGCDGTRVALTEDNAALGRRSSPDLAKAEGHAH
jgi:hypothetical protein